MGLEITASSDSVYPVVITDVLEFAEGGGTLQKSALPTTVEELLEGTPVYLDLATKLAHVVKTATVQAQAAKNVTSIRVKKVTPDNHPFIVGDFITNGVVSTAITAINTTQATYDTLTLTATLDAYNVIPVDTVLYQGSSETTAAPVAATAVVEDIVAATLTLTDASGTLNGVIVDINHHGDDNLHVAFTPANKTLTIDLADTTAAKNTAALIQAAIRALTLTGEFDLTRISCAAGGTWDAAAIGDILTVPTDSFAGGSPLADIAPKYTVNGIVAGNYDITGENNAIGIVVRGTVKEALCPYSVTAAMKTALKGLIRFV